MRFKQTHIFIAVIIILLLNVTSADAINRFFSSQKEKENTSSSSDVLTTENAQPGGTDLHAFDLITEQEGWVLMGQNVYWTTDAGQSWTNISPAGLRPDGVRGVTFLDTLNGWMVYAQPNDAGEMDYYMARTFDRGRAWQVQKLPLFQQGDPDGIGDAIYLQFLDTRTGYLVVRRATSTNFRVGTLFKTTDGGTSWTRLNIPIGEPVLFTSESSGWVAGGASGEELYQTQDGGRSWNRKQVNTPIKGSEKRLYRLPVFEDANKGLLPVVISDGENSRVEYHVTTNRGNSWKLLDSLPVGRGIYKGSDVPLSIFSEREWVLVMPNSRRSVKSIEKKSPSNPVIIQETAAPEATQLPTETETAPLEETSTPTEAPATGDTETTPEAGATEAAVETPTVAPQDTPTLALTDTPAPLDTLVPSPTTEAVSEETEIVTVMSSQPLSESIRELDMVSTSVGWARTMNGSCQMADPETPVNCTLSVSLLLTQDGGESWQTLRLPENTTISLANYVNNTDMYLGQGFDSCSMPSLTLMQDWIVNSPYRVWNLYIGGSSRAGCGTLTKSYIEALAQQGWKFIITWVGPQAACTTFTTRMSYDTTTAYNQGVAEANMAIDRAFELGLTNPDKTGALIYYDLESYDTNNATCRAAAKSFMNGWTKQLQSRSNLSGVYGSPCSSAMSDFAANPNVPDAVWLAAWISPYQYRSSVSLTSLSCISNTLWPNQQRMRQYTGSHREAWGSSVISSIDSNVIDSPVAVLDKNGSCPQSRGALLYWNNTYSCTNTSGNPGYQQFLNPGFYNISGAFNDQAASMRLPTGWSAVVYQNADRGGGKLCYNTSVTNFANEGNFPGTNIAINKQISSIEVFDNPSCSASPAPKPTGGYWSATYYNTNNLGDQCAAETTSGPYLFKDWGAASPHKDCNADNWSARFTQTVRFPEGKYTFNLGADDRARLKIGSETIIDRWSSTATSSAVRTLAAGDYTITVEYAELTGSARVAAWWTGAGGYTAPRQTRDPNQWYAQYWGNLTQWWDSIVRVNEGTGPLNRQWGLGSAGYGLPSDKFSARYLRDVTLECGTYTFEIKADDGVRFYVNNVLHLDQWKDQTATYQVPVTLAAGTYTLRVDHYDNIGSAQISLDWTRTLGCTGVPTATPTRTNTSPPPTATRTPTATNAPPTLTPTPLPDFLFADGFESGSFSAWSAAVTDGGDLSVTAAAALAGSRGMQVNINDLNPLYAEHNSGYALPVYRARFYFHPNSISMAEADVFQIFNGVSPENTPMAFLRFRRYQGSYQIQLGARTDSDVNTYTAWTNVSNDRHYVELEWRSGVPGSARIWLDGAAVGSLSVSNSKWRLQTARFGAVSGVKAGTRGVMYFDEYEARTISYIGPSSAAQVTPTPTVTATNPPPTATNIPPTSTFTRTPTSTSVPPTATLTRTPTQAPTQATGDLIFADGFETGNFSRWNAVLSDNNDLRVTTNSALVGSYGMQALINDNNSMFAQHTAASDLAAYRARFYFHPNSISMAEADVFQIFNGLNSSNTPMLFVRFRRYQGSYQIQLGARTNSDVNTYTAWTKVSNAPHYVELEWKSGAPGSAAIWLDGTRIGTLSVSNSKWKVRTARFGAVSGVKTGTRGTMYFDEYEARATTYIGPASGQSTQPTQPPAAPTATFTRTPTSTSVPPTATFTRTPTQAPTQITGDLIFADGFETGNFSRWNAVLSDNNDLRVTTNSALVGSYGMQALINDNNSMFAQHTAAADLAAYRARFYFHPNSISMAEADVFQIFNGLNSSNTPMLFVRFRRYQGSYQIQLGARTNSDVNTYTAWTKVSNAPHYVELEWKSGAPGSAAIWLDGTRIGTLSVSNSKWKVRTARFGAVSGVKAGTRGTMYFDEYEARTTTYIGASTGSVNQPNPAPTATSAPTTAPTAAPTRTPTTAPTTKPVDLLFADSFESGNLSAWPSQTTGGGDLSVTSAAALVGNRGMQALINDNNAIFVHNALSSAQTRYRVRFYFHPNSISMAEGDLFNIYNAYDNLGNTNVMIRMRRSLGSYQIQVAARDNTTWVMTGWYTIPNAKQSIEIDWKAASSSTTTDGWVYLYIDGSVKTSLALKNGGWNVARDRLGAVEGIDTGTRGTLYFDHFEARRTTYIGP